MKLREIITEDLSAKSNISYHDTLNPAGWEGEEMIPEVRKRLLEIAKVFISYLEIENFKLKDVVLTGSNANYNWTQYSDFDVHVVTDYKKLNCDDIAEAFYNAKKKIWNDAHDITVNGHDVEMYVEDAASPPVSQGMYSLITGEWLSKPTFDPPKINDSAVTAKAKSFAQLIDKSINKRESSADLEALQQKIRNMRRAGLDEAGEFSTENLAYKVLRNQGYLDKLHNAIHSAQDRELSIK